MSNYNVHLMIEKMDTLRKYMFESLGQYRFEVLTNLDLVFDAVTQVRDETDGKLERASEKLDEIIECTILKEEKRIVLNRVGQLLLVKERFTKEKGEK